MVMSGKPSAGQDAWACPACGCRHNYGDRWNCKWCQGPRPGRQPLSLSQHAPMLQQLPSGKGGRWNNRNKDINKPKDKDKKQQVAKPIDPISRLSQQIEQLRTMEDSEELLARKLAERAALQHARDMAKPRSQIVRSRETQLERAQQRAASAQQVLEAKEAQLAKLQMEVEDAKKTSQAALAEVAVAQEALDSELTKPTEPMAGPTTLPQVDLMLQTIAATLPAEAAQCLAGLQAILAQQRATEGGSCSS